jgi:hypothetical protein
MAGGTKARRVGGRALGRDGTEDAGCLQGNPCATKGAHSRRSDAAPLQVRRKIVRSCSANPARGLESDLEPCQCGVASKEAALSLSLGFLKKT